MTPDTSTDYIELNTFIKIKGLASTGGQAKNLIRQGSIKVNNVVETRNKRKLRAGDIVDFLGKQFEIRNHKKAEFNRCV